jgi:hypothetical protein
VDYSAAIMTLFTPPPSLPPSLPLSPRSYRTAADWVAIRAGLPPLPPLPASAFHATPSSLPPSGPPSAKGGLVVVGSYVPKSSEQLACLLEGGQAEKIEVRAIVEEMEGGRE